MVDFFNECGNELTNFKVGEMREMKVEKLNVFMSSVSAFFSQVGEVLHEIDTPYLNDNHTPVAYDYSGVISITGPIKGSVYVSATTTMLRDLLKALHEPEETISLLKDLVGEIANTVSGNARTEFGPDFIISPPTVVIGAPSVQYLPANRRTYVIPFYWREHKAAIGICIWNAE